MLICFTEQSSNKKKRTANDTPTPQEEEERKASDQGGYVTPVANENTPTLKEPETRALQQLADQGILFNGVDTQTKIASYVSSTLFKYVKFIETQEKLDDVVGNRSIARLVITGLNVVGQNKKKWWDLHKGHVLRTLNCRRAWASSECGKEYLSK